MRWVLAQVRPSWLARPVVEKFISEVALDTGCVDEVG